MEKCGEIEVWLFIKVGLSTSKKTLLFASLKALKNYEKCFLFHLKSSLRSQVFLLTFWSCRKNGLIRKIRLTSKFMTSQPG